MLPCRVLVLSKRSGEFSSVIRGEGREFDIRNDEFKAKLLGSSLGHIQPNSCGFQPKLIRVFIISGTSS